MKILGKIIKSSIFVMLVAIIWQYSITTADNSWRYSSWDWFWKNFSDKVGWVWTIWASGADSTESKLLDTIQNAINRILWMLSFVALILCLRGWFQMLTAAWDDWKVKTWTKILKNAAIGLAVIWVSWLVVSFVFWIINKVSS